MIIISLLTGLPHLFLLTTASGWHGSCPQEGLRVEAAKCLRYKALPYMVKIPVTTRNVNPKYPQLRIQMQSFL